MNRLSRLVNKKVLFWLVAALVFILGLVIRFYDFTDAPLDFASTRQMRSVIIARGLYYQGLNNVPEWQRQQAIEQGKGEGIIEPQIMETITAWTYRVIGSEQLWVARLYSILFWMAGSIALLLLALELTGYGGALVAFTYFLILPYGAIASRAFQPDPLMVALIVFALWGGVRWQRTQSWKWAVAAGILGGLAILVKNVAVFFIAPAWAGLILFGPGIRKSIRSKQVWTIAGLSIAPYAAYHIYGVYIAGFLGSQFGMRFFPQLWSNPVTYLQWTNELATVVGLEWFLVAAAGIFLLKGRAERAMLAAAFIGYFAFGMTFTFHITTHDYYQMPLIPLVALGLAAAADMLIKNLRGPRILVYAAVLAVVLFWTTIKAWDVRVTLKRNDYTNEVTYWKNLGKKFPEGSKVVGLTQDYGYRLEYWGWVALTNWMNTNDINLRELSGQQIDELSMFKNTVAGKDYFVVTMMDEFNNQPALKDVLTKNYPVLEKGSDFIIFDLRK